MDWGNFFYLLIILIVGFLPYKVIQKIRPTGISHISFATAIFLDLWFIFFSLILFLQSQLRYINIYSFPASLFVAVTVVWFGAPFFIRKIGRHPKIMLEKNPKRYTLRFDPHTFHLKYFEVLFQQSQFFFLLTVVLASFSFNDRIAWFTVITGLLHMGNIFFITKREALLFSILSIPMAFIFSIMILNGLLLITTSIHLWFYLVFAGYPWFQKNHKR